MEMDMDMDELERLEGLLPEEEEEDYYYPDEEEAEQQHHQQQLPPTTPKIPQPSGGGGGVVITDNQINSNNNNKRSWSKSNSNDLDDPSSDASFSSGLKRNRLEEPPIRPEGDEDEEEWLRYSRPPTPQPSVPVVEEQDQNQEKFISRFASEVDGVCISVTGPSGCRVYAKVTKMMNTTSLHNKSITSRSFSSKGLISEPVSVLMKRWEEDASIKALQVSSESSDAFVSHQSSVVTENLWVDKYSPKSFTELLSDEQTNREILLWLKQWDTCVFGSEIRSTSTDVLSSLRRHTSLAQHQKLSHITSFGKTGKTSFTSSAFKHSDSFNREHNNVKEIHESGNKKSMSTGPPDHKVLLLCGPPGLGKTTLAHVAAKHCGYRVVEINASDDRSSSTIEAKILDVVQMNSVMADAKPKCLIIDEIDGALGEGKGAVEVILKMLAAEKKSEFGKENFAQKEQGKFSSKRGKKTATLSRPVICICNNLFAPSLRPLRQVAKVHMFVKPSVSRVVNRLKFICNKEGFRASSVALTALAAHTECDIRSCLNTLQFLNKQKTTLNVLEINSQVVGQKDIAKGVFDVWKEVFQKRKTNREQKSPSSSMPSDFDFMHSLISNCGDYDITMDGIHENILHLQHHDPVMQKTVKCLNILGVSDHLQQYIMRTQHMALHAYQPSTVIAINRLIAQIGKPNIEWPKSSQRSRAMLIEKRDLLRCWCNKITPSISRHLSTESFVGDAVSPFMYILSPPTLRPVAFHLLSEKEKQDLAQLVNTMVSYSVSYKNMNPEKLPCNLRHEAILDVPVLSLDPPIADFINFKDYISAHTGLSLAVKRVLVHEVEKQKILSGSATRLMQSDGLNNNQNQAPTRGGKAFPSKTVIDNGQQSNTKISTNTSTSGSNKLLPANVESKGLIGAKKPARSSSSFFDSFRKKSGKFSQDTDNGLQKPATIERDSRPLIFKFNEGFTNAVKKPVRISELLS